MKITELCTSSGWGGLELYALNISRWLHQEGHDCQVVIQPGSLIAQRLQGSNLQNTYLKPHLRLFPLVAAWRLAKILDQQASDILHVHWNKDLVLAVLAKCFSKHKPKLVFIRHMALTRHKRDAYHRFIYRNIDAYLVITKRLQAEAEKYLPLDRDKIHLLYHGVAEQKQADEASCDNFLQERGLNKNSFRVLLPGRIEHGKGQHVLLEAVQLLQKKGLDVEVAMLGHIMDQAYFDKLKSQINSSGLANRVHYLGFVENPVYIYNCFDVVVLTTYAETFGLVLIEAMKCTVPVIGTNAGGVPEIIENGKTGLLFEPGDSTGLAECLEKLTNDPVLRNKMAVTGHKFADEVFSEQQHHTKLMQILNILLSNSNN